MCCTLNVVHCKSTAWNSEPRLNSNDNFIFIRPNVRHMLPNHKIDYFGAVIFQKNTHKRELPLRGTQSWTKPKFCYDSYHNIYYVYWTQTPISQFSFRILWTNIKKLLWSTYIQCNFSFIVRHHFRTNQTLNSLLWVWFETFSFFSTNHRNIVCS